MLPLPFPSFPPFFLYSSSSILSARLQARRRRPDRNRNARRKTNQTAGSRKGERLSVLLPHPMTTIAHSFFFASSRPSPPPSLFYFPFICLLRINSHVNSIRRTRELFFFSLSLSLSSPFPSHPQKAFFAKATGTDDSGKQSECKRRRIELAHQI